jgi:hypothetical protein
MKRVVLLAVVGCTSPRDFMFDATFDPQQAQITVNGADGVMTIHAEYATYAKAQQLLAIPVTVTLSGNTVASTVQPGYCASAASVLGVELGDVWVETVQLMPAADLTLTPESLHCEASKGGLDQAP